MRVHLCGVRGSTPAVGAEFAEVGGNTSCVALAHDDESAPRLVLDAGTGLRAVSGAAGRRGRSTARSCSATCTGTTRKACRSSVPPTVPTR